jgi:hypothetical protein
MVKTGRLEIAHNGGTGGSSRLNAGPGDRKRLAKEEGEGDPFGNANEFLVSERGLDDGDFIFVVGENGTHSGVAVIFITDAGLAENAEMVITSATVSKKTPAKKAGKKSGKKAKKK